MVRDRPGVAGALLVGGASERFGSPKALARFEGETLAERGHRVLAEAFEEVIVVGKAADRARASRSTSSTTAATFARRLLASPRPCASRARELVVVLPTDMPQVTVGLLRELAGAAEGYDVAVPQTGPLPGAYRRTALPVLERRIAAGDLALHRALAELRVRVVELDEASLRNVNAPRDLPAEP